MKDGRMVASNIPKKRRAVSRPAKLVPADVQMVTILPERISFTDPLERRLLTGDHVEHDPVLDRENDQGIRRQRLADELGNVDDGAEPRVLGADELGLFLQVEDGRVRDRRLVKLSSLATSSRQPKSLLTCWMKYTMHIGKHT
jgi:hypothetical protein